MKKRCFLFAGSIFTVMALLLSCTTVLEEKKLPSKPSDSLSIADTQLLVETDWLEREGNNPILRILDYGRKLDDFQAGHIPGAVNIDWILNLRRDVLKSFAPEGEMAKLNHSRKISKDKTIVTLCQTGVRGAHTYFVLRRLGYPTVMVYDGSWAEWGNDFEKPVVSETGD